jgi:hypothetical protein
MIRLLPRALPATLLALLCGALARAEDNAASVNYFLPVTYQMVVTHPDSTTTTDTREKTDLAFQLFNNREILRLILGSTTPLANWTLVAAGNSTEFAASPKPFSTLRLAARNRRTGEVRNLPEGASFNLTLSDASAQATTEVRKAATPPETTPGELLSRSVAIEQLAFLNQEIPGAGFIFDALGSLSHGTLLDEIKGATNLGPLLRPTSASYRASGGFEAEDETKDGMVELFIRFGTPTSVVVESD